MANKEVKQLDVKLHNFIGGQLRYNDKVYSSLHEHKKVLKHLIACKMRELDTTVCMSAIK